MKRIFFFTICIMVMASLATALTLTVPANEYNRGQNVVTSIQGCAGDSVLQLKSPEGILIGIDQGRANWEFTYNTNSDRLDGKYQVQVACEDGEKKEISFCVDAPGCVAPVVNQLPPPGANQPPTSTGGGRRCITSWSCTAWGHCNNELKESRTCTDSNSCPGSVPRIEEQECLACDERWICNAWSPCRNGAQTRTCNDANSCATISSRPALQRACSQEVVGNSFQDRSQGVQGSQPKETVRDVVGSQGGVVETTDNNLVLIGSIVGGIVLLVAIILLTLHFTKKRNASYSVADLQSWVRQEKSSGTPVEHIREILADRTGWDEQKINSSFRELREPGSIVGGTKSFTAKNQQSLPTSKSQQTREQ
jgi:hypothetical protein